MMDYASFYRRSIDEPEAFWSEQARLIDWHTPFDTVCDDSDRNSPTSTVASGLAGQTSTRCRSSSKATRHF